MSTISSGTTLTTALVQTGDTTGNLVIKTGSSNTTAMTISGSDQSITFSGAVNVASTAFANGSASAPSITFTGDPNTGIFSPAADTIGFAEGGTEVMRITSTGLVGVGTSSPDSKLSVALNGGGAVGKFISNTGSTYISVGAASTYQTQIGYDISSEYGFIQPIAATGVYDDLALCALGGRVGIGTSSPSAKLHVTTGATGIQALFASGTGTPTIAVGYTTANYNTQLGYNVVSEYGYLQATAAAGVYDDMAINPLGGNVGIGTSSPALGLVVEKDNGSGYVAGFRNASGSPILTIQNTGGVSQIQGLNSALSATANIAMQLSGGRVGIGTASPSSLLDVNTSAAGNFVARITNNSGASSSDHALLVETSTASAAKIISARNAGVERFLVTGNGDVSVFNSFLMNSGYGSAAIAFGCRAWVNFNGTGSVAIRGSGNVSSVSDNGTGDYTVNFSTAMPDTNYSAVFGGVGEQGGAGADDLFVCINRLTAAVATTSLRIGTRRPSVLVDPPIVCVSIFR